MAKPAELIADATTVIDAAVAASPDPTAEETVLAAGIFGHALPSNAEMAVAGAAADSLPHGGNGLIEAVENVTAMAAVRAMDAERDGLTVRMLVAVTATDIHLLDWQTGSGTTRILRSLGRVSTDVTIKKLGLSRRVELLDHATGTDVHIVGTTAAFSPEAAGDKAVLDLLDVPG